jgi:hypothetical protein
VIEKNDFSDAALTVKPTHLSVFLGVSLPLSETEPEK